MDDLELQIKEALCCDVDDVHQCAEDKYMALFLSLDEVAPRIAAALRATAARGVFAGRESTSLMWSDEWSAVEQAKQDAEAAGLAALKGGDDG